MIEPISDEIQAAGINRENLPITFDYQVKIFFHILIDFQSKRVKLCFIPGKDDHIIAVTKVIFYLQFLFKPVIKISQIEVGKILAQVITNRQTGGTFNYLIQEPENILVFDFSPEKLFENIVVYVWIELTDVKLETIFCAGIIP